MRVSPYQAAEPLQPTGCGHGTAGAIRTIQISVRTSEFKHYVEPFTATQLRGMDPPCEGSEDFIIVPPLSGRDEWATGQMVLMQKQMAASATLYYYGIDVYMKIQYLW